MPKRLFNLLVSLLVRFADWLSNGMARLVGGGRRTCMVLAYHSVSDEERGIFAEQMDWLLRTAMPVRADVETLPSKRGHYAAVTFDDGFENVFRNALPELEKRNIPSTLFIVTEALGGKRAWEHLGGDDTRNEQVMSPEQLRQLRPELVQVGSHTMNHPLLPTISGAALHQELAGSRLKLEQITGHPVTTLSFPYGGFNQAILDGCREAGYARVFSALPVYAFSEPAEFISGRVGTAPTDWPIEFRLKLAGAYRWLPLAFALKRRLREMMRGGPKPVAANTVQKRTA